MQLWIWNYPRMLFLNEICLNHIEGLKFAKFWMKWHCKYHREIDLEISLKIYFHTRSKVLCPFFSGLHYVSFVLIPDFLVFCLGQQHVHRKSGHGRPNCGNNCDANKYCIHFHEELDIWCGYLSNLDRRWLYCKHSLHPKSVHT